MCRERKKKIIVTLKKMTCCLKDGFKGNIDKTKGGKDCIALKCQKDKWALHHTFVFFYSSLGCFFFIFTSDIMKLTLLLSRLTQITSLALNFILYFSQIPFFLHVQLSSLIALISFSSNIL